MPPRRYIVLVGGLAVGKTSTARRVGELMSAAEIFIETRDEYLEAFYADPGRFAFLNQLAYTLQFVEQAALIAKSDAELVVQDRSIYDTHEVFTLSRFQEKAISEREVRLLERGLRAADIMIRPNAIVLLEADAETAYARLVDRGETVERQVTLDYMRGLDAAHRQWFDRIDWCPTESIRTDDRSVNQVAENVLDIANTLRIGP